MQYRIELEDILTFNTVNVPDALLPESTPTKLRIRFNAYTNQFSFYHPEETVPQGQEWISVSLPQYEFLIQQTRLGKVLKVNRGDVIAVAPESPPVTMYALRASVLKSLQSIVDTRAREMGYEDASEVISYADEPCDLQFQTEGKAFRRWRAQSRRAVLDLAERLRQEGTRTLPRTIQVEAVLPAFELVPPEVDHSPSQPL